MAIHVRRGDALEPRHRARVTGNESLLQILRNVLPRCTHPEGELLRLRVMSEGSAADFDFIQHLDVPFELHLDQCPFTTFHHLAMANTLVTAKSTFSYMAAILNPGQVFYEPFWHEPLPRWEIVAPNEPDSNQSLLPKPATSSTLPWTKPS